MTEDDVPPHPIVVDKSNNDYGRCCLRCGFPVPSGYRYVHASWCENRPKDAVETVMERLYPDE